MRNGPVLWAEILATVRNIGGINPIIAGGAVRDYVLKLGDPRDIDVFIGGTPPDDMQLDIGWNARNEERDREIQAEYNGQIGTIAAIQNWSYVDCNFPVQFIWIGDNDPVRYVRGFDLGTSKCYYRGSLVLGKDFLNDWHHQQITIFETAFQRPRNIERSRERARELSRRYPNGARIIEQPPVNNGAQNPVNQDPEINIVPVPMAVNIQAGAINQIDGNNRQFFRFSDWIMLNDAGAEHPVAVLRPEAV